LTVLAEAIDKVVASESHVDVARFRADIERLEHAWLERVRDAERRGDWHAEGFVSSAAWLRERCRMTHGAAAAAIELARKLESLPATSEAFANGAISRAHAQVIARAATAERIDAIAEVEAALMLAAKSVAPKQLRVVVQHVTDALDGDGGAAGACARHERRRLHVSPMLDGMVAVDGMLDAEGGELVLSALESAMAAARDARDTRSTPQRRADALVELCRASGPRSTRRDPDGGTGRTRRWS
jgi:hypothetical protein